MSKILCIIILLFVLQVNSSAQPIKDTATYQAMVSNALYNYDALGDSLADYASRFFDFAISYPYPEAAIQANKIMGIYHEVNADYDSALYYYEQGGNEAAKQNNQKAVTATLFDKMSVYLEMQQYEPAKKILYQALLQSTQLDNKKLIGITWSNLGIVFRRLKQQDSAYYAYKQAITFKQQLKDSVGIANTRTNLASLLIADNRYAEALVYLQQNILFYKQNKRYGELWYGYFSSLDAYRSLGNLNKAQLYADSATAILEQYNMTHKLPILLNGLAALAFQKGEYKKAFLLRDSASILESSRIDDDTRSQITALNKKYQVKQKQQQNNLLTAQLANKKLQQRNMWIAGAALAMLTLGVFIAWFNIKKKNALLQQKTDVIASQNQQLTHLNDDKNQLISMVSHDLGQPFNQLKVWATLLEKKLQDQPADIQEPLLHIQQSIAQGQRLIHHVLDVEKASANSHNLVLESINLKNLLEDVATDFAPAALSKQIVLTAAVPDNITLLTDRQHLLQVLENIVSNALKFSNKGGAVQLQSKTLPNGKIIIEVIDNGPGLDASEIEMIFNKYAIASTRPTAGEHSTGLGLSIVKRLMLELGGTVNVESEKGKGACFRLTF